MFDFRDAKTFYSITVINKKQKLKKKSHANFHSFIIKKIEVKHNLLIKKYYKNK